MGATEGLWVEGIATEPPVLADGRAPHTVDQLRSMVANFRVGTVPIVSRHGGSLLGWVDMLWVEGRDLAFAGSVTADADLARRLREGRVPVSIETLGPPEYMARALAPRVARNSYFRGATGVASVILCGIAIAQNPAAPGSAMWRDTRPPTVASIAGYWTRSGGHQTRTTDMVQPTPALHLRAARGRPAGRPA